MGIYAANYRTGGPIGISISIPSTVKAGLQAWARRFPSRLQNGILKRAGKKIAAELVTRVKRHVPYNKNKENAKAASAAGGKLSNTHKNLMHKPWHARDMVSSRVKAYKKGVTYIAVGYKRNTVPLQALIEYGNFLTRPRRIGHKTHYIRTTSEKMIRRRKTITRADGSKRTRWETVKKGGSQSFGSFRLPGEGERRTWKMKGVDTESRGNFPKNGEPYAPLRRALAEMKSMIPAIVEAELVKGLKAAGKRRVAAIGRANIPGFK